jgi:hypothetical protein
MASRTKADLEAENARQGEVLDSIADVVDDDELSASKKVAAVQVELNSLDDEDEDEQEEDDE